MSSADRLVSPREALTIARIVKVNHAGEYGAIRIYAAQIAVARRLDPVEIPALADMREHEERHCAAFRDAMPARGSRPCRIMALWSRGGWLPGFMTALLGRQGIWACTAAVEAAVHRHLDDQLHFLARAHHAQPQVGVPERRFPVVGCPVGLEPGFGGADARRHHR